MNYRVRVSCRDCTGQDYMGCFDGGTDMLSDRKPPYAVRYFATVESAEEAGYDETANCGPWEFEVLDADDVVVLDSGKF